MNIGELFIKLGLKKEGFDKGLDDSKKKVSGFGDSMSKVGSMIASVFAVGAIVGFVSNIIKVRQEFEKYEAVLTNTLGSNKQAKQEMAMLQEVAAKTPFSLTELTGAYVKLVNYGLKPTKEEIIKLGDLASSTGKGFNQLTEAVADAVTGQYERLKEFGIKAAVSGDKVTFTFKEQKTAVDNNAQSIKAYMLGLGDLKGVSGAMAAISETLGGKISNLGDSWDKFLNTLGSGSSGVFTTVISWLSSLVETVTWAAMSISDIKSMVLDKSTLSAMEGALGEIKAMKKSLTSGGMSESDAEKKAIELYYDSIENRIKELNKSRKEGTTVLKVALVAERNAVKDHLIKLELDKKKVKDIDHKTAVEKLADLKKIDDELDAQRILNMDFYGQKGMPIKPIEPPKSIGTPNIDSNKLGNLDSFTKENKEKTKKFTKESLQEWTDFTTQLDESISSGMADAVSSLSSGLGELFATGDWGNFGEGVLKTIGSFMQQMGGLFIAYAIASKGFAAALGLGPANPMAWGLAMAAGVGLVVAGSAISSLASSGGKSSGGGGSYAASGYSNTGGQSSMSAIPVTGVFELHGTVLKAAIQNTDRKNQLTR